MPCFVPFNNDNLDLTFCVLRPLGVSAEELISAMKCLSSECESLGCAYSSIFKSIHGNLIIWYGAWIRRSQENKEILNTALLSSLAEVSHLAIVIQYGFYEAYAGEARVSGQSSTKNANVKAKAAKFSTGDTLLLSGLVPTTSDPSDLSYACLALNRSYFAQTDGISATVCFRLRQEEDQLPMVSTLIVWKSLQDCYSWLLNSDYRHTIRPYISHLSHDVQFDIFKVVYVSTDDAVNAQ